MNEPRIRIVLYGILRRKFGKEFTFVGRCPADAIRALCRMKKGFAEHLRQQSEPGYHLLAGERALEPSEAYDPTNQTIKLIPAVAGANAGLRIIVGVVLVAVGIYLSWTGFGAAIGNIGMAMILGGVSEMLAKPPSFAPVGLDKGPKDTPSYAFQGPHMTTGQGNCVPVGFGRARVGGALISVGKSAETWPVKGFGGSAPDEIGTIGGDGDTAPWTAAVAPA